MAWFKKKEALPNSEYFLDGFIQGVAVTLFGGPIFIVGLAIGWVYAVLLIVCCFVAYFLLRQIVQVYSLFSGEGRSEIWWLGSVLGFCLVMPLFFSFLSLPIN